MNQGWVYRDQVSATGNGQTVLDYYCQRYRHSTKEEWNDRILSGQILLNDAPTTPTTQLKAGQSLTYHRQPWQEPEVPLTFEVLHEDPDLLIINKPSGLPVMPGGGFLQHTLLWQLKQHYPKDTPTPIHRLGRGTSGLLLLARSPHARAHLSRQMREGSCQSSRDRPLQKTYLAIVGSGAIPDEFSIDTPIGKIPHPTLGYLHAATPKGKFASSEGRVLQRSATQTLVEVTILTGRPHQIRIHLAAIGFPLIGDPLYGIGGTLIQEDISVPGHCGYFLHAHRLTFMHPRTETRMTVKCLPPQAFSERLKG
jgi:23S rRNA pseudouridine1911/1915/1917 synthase